MFIAVAFFALFLRLPWPAAIAFSVAGMKRKPLLLAAIACAAWALYTRPFEQGQALLADAVLPFSLLSAAPLLPRRKEYGMANILCAAAAIFLAAAARTQNPIAEVAGALMLALAGIVAR